MSTTRINPEYTIPEVVPELERGPQWLREKRRVSRADFNRAPLPRRGLQLWRYTDPAKFMFAAAADSPDINGSSRSVEQVEQRHLSEGRLSGLVIDAGGREIRRHGCDELRRQGVVVAALSEAVDSHHDLVATYLYGLVNSQTGKFEAMNGALWNDGVFIYVPANTRVTKPVHLLREAGGSGSAQFPRLLVIVGRNAEFTLIDEYGGGAVSLSEGNSYSNGVVEIYGLEDSRTRYVSLQRQAGGMDSYLTHRARIERGAAMLTIPLVFGASTSKQNFGVILNGPGAESNMYGLLFGAERRHYDNHTLHHHADSRTHSNIDFKVVLRDRAESAYTGLIRIDEPAQTCEAYQENRNLLLTSGTRAESIPELEILNEDVMCSHGATGGPIDPEMLFFLRSRGITEAQAMRMVVTGFMAGTLQQVPEDLRERIGGYVSERLEAH
jgi:Fe-S cluster assembly protein SufD